MRDDESTEELSDEVEVPESIDIVYKESEDYRLYPATGVRGGVQMQNNMKLDFVSDHNVDPNSETFEVNEDGSLGEKIDEDWEPTIIREKLVGVSMRQDRALSAGSWIISTLLGQDVTEDDITNLIRKEYPEKFGPQELEDEE